MSYKEAIEDAIPFEQRVNSRLVCYYPPCYYCGASVETYSYIRGMRYACKECRALVVAMRRSENRESKKEAKLETALKRIAKVANIEKYMGAADFVRSTLDTRGWYQSTEEIMTALELKRRNIDMYPQYEVGPYHVDFLLPSMKVALEIDGRIFHNKDRAFAQELRDDAIKNILGADWEVVHISTDCINQNVTRLLAGIKGVLEHRRRKNFFALHNSSVQIT